MITDRHLPTRTSARTYKLRSMFIWTFVVAVLLGWAVSIVRLQSAIRDLHQKGHQDRQETREHFRKELERLWKTQQPVEPAARRTSLRAHPCASCQFDAILLGILLA